MAERKRSHVGLTVMALAALTFCNVPLSPAGPNP